MFAVFVKFSSKKRECSSLHAKCKTALCIHYFQPIQDLLPPDRFNLIFNVCDFIEENDQTA